MYIRKILLGLFLCLSMSMWGADNEFVKIVFGTSRNEAVQMLKMQFGEPNATTDDAFIYYDMTVNGYKFSKIVFGFEPKQSGGYFNEARFFIVEPTRKLAVVDRDSLARLLGTHYGITYDFEENGNKFYKGGISPAGIGHLFTICTHRREGKWTTELRYGAFHKLKKKQ